MPVTYEPIATYTVSGGSPATFNFTSIPATYTDLRIVTTVASTATSNFYLRINADSSSLYSWTRVSGDGSTASSTRTTNQTIWQLNNSSIDSTLPEQFTIDIFDYAGSTFKTALWTSSQDNNGSGTTSNYVGLYRSTTAITSLSLQALNPVDVYNDGSIATLYGIKNA
jgi:hypothetical protein